MPRPWSSVASALPLALAISGEASAASGGPDAFGYTYVDQADGAPYAYIDITSTGALVTSGDEGTGTMILGEPFSLYGAAQLELAVSTNGFVTTVAGAATDPTNDCPMPAALDDTPGFPRIAVLHNDLVADVYYQYLTPAEAGMAGFAGLTAGISVFQWVGAHFFPMGSAVDAEVVLFHQDDSMLLMIAADSDGGQQSTTGLQNAAATTGLEYGCNTLGYLTPGVTAVWIQLPDSDCCTASPVGLPGCTAPACEAAVCAIDPTCCANQWNAICAALAVTNCPATCGDCGNGAIDAGEECDTAGESAACDVDCTFAMCGDGLLNTTAGEACDDGGESVTCDTDCTAAMCGDGLVNMTTGEACDDMGESATCDIDCTTVVCGDGITNMTSGEACDDGGESATCDTDCTAVVCGDGITNMTAGESCDDMGESVACNADCSVAGCGDGLVNMTAGEECDESGTTANCDDDCTAPECGDGFLNTAAGEDCDDGNVVDGDGCAADCTEEVDPTTGGMDSSGSGSSSGDQSTTTGDDTTVGDTTTGPADSTSTGSSVDSSGGPLGSTSGEPAGSSSSSGDSSGGTDASFDPGCNCTTQPPDGGPWPAWLLLGFGAMGLRRRRPSS